MTTNEDDHRERIHVGTIAPPLRFQRTNTTVMVVEYAELEARKTSSVVINVLPQLSEGIPNAHFTDQNLVSQLPHSSVTPRGGCNGGIKPCTRHAGIRRLIHTVLLNGFCATCRYARAEGIEL
ncbi:hypothetical protein MKX01_020168 [Papaver californicum]|nr:hypothetical protein MKX01_020168 [Papaver californicum]